MVYSTRWPNSGRQAFGSFHGYDSERAPLTLATFSSNQYVVHINLLFANFCCYELVNFMDTLSSSFSPMKQPRLCITRKQSSSVVNSSQQKLFVRYGYVYFFVKLVVTKSKK